MTLCEGTVIRATDLRLPDSGNDSANAEAEPEPTAIPESPAEGPAPLENYLDTLEKQAIIKALEQTRYNKTAAAKLLGITFRALRYRLKKLGLE